MKERQHPLSPPLWSLAAAPGSRAFQPPVTASNYPQFQLCSTIFHFLPNYRSFPPLPACGERCRLFASSFPSFPFCRVARGFFPGSSRRRLARGRSRGRREGRRKRREGLEDRLKWRRGRWKESGRNERRK